MMADFPSLLAAGGLVVDLLQRAAGVWPGAFLATPIAASLLIEATLKVSLILLIAFAVTGLVRQQSAALRHWILSAAIVSALAVPFLSFYLPAVPLSIMQGASGPALTQALGVPEPRIVDVTIDFEIPAEAHEEIIDARIKEAAARARRGARVEMAQAMVSSGSPGVWFAMALVVIWVLGTSLRMSTLIVGLGRLAWLARRARVADDDDEAVVMARGMAEACGVRRSIRVLHSQHPTLLFTWGYFRPSILLPAGASAWRGERLRVVLAHEVAHVARGDWPMQIAAELLRALVWCTPLVWMACRRLRAESEQACDDVVLSGGVGAPEYASHLLALARVCTQPRDPWSPALGMVRQSVFERRIRAMLNTRLNRAPLTAVARAGIALAFMVASLPLAAVSAIAQTEPSGLVGIVRNPLGKPVPGAEVAVTSTATQKTENAKSDASGRIELKGLPAGAYRVSIRAIGFEPFSQDVSLAAGKRVERDFTLTLGTVQETITVRGAGSGAPKVTPPQPLQVAPGKADVALTPPRKVQHAAPVYPKSAYDAGAKGTVLLEATIAKDGTVSAVKVVKPVHPELDKAAADAVKLWRFTPTTLYGVPVETRMKVSIDFGM